ncbi:MAG: GNAT family N-acetyltransferase [Acidaminobacteraceae bacterium]
MKIIELKEEYYGDFLEGLVSSFSKDYIPLGITKENAKSNGSFFTKNHMYNYINKGVKFFVILDKEILAGGIGILEKDDYCKVKKLFVTIEYQNIGVGKKLMDFAEEYTKSLSKAKVKLGMIRDKESLHRFYEKCGYIDKKISLNRKMNLNVAFMEKKI